MSASSCSSTGGEKSSEELEEEEEEEALMVRCITQEEDFPSSSPPKRGTNEVKKEGSARKTPLDLDAEEIVFEDPETLKSDGEDDLLGYDHGQYEDEGRSSMMIPRSKTCHGIDLVASSSYPGQESVSRELFPFLF